MGTTALRRSLALLSCLACVVMLAGCLPAGRGNGGHRPRGRHLNAPA